MIATSLDEEEYPQPARLPCLHAGCSRQDLPERVCVDTMKWPNPPSCGAAALFWGCPGVTAVPTPPGTHGESEEEN